MLFLHLYSTKFHTTGVLQLSWNQNMRLLVIWVIDQMQGQDGCVYVKIIFLPIYGPNMNLNEWTSWA